MGRLLFKKEKGLFLPKLISFLLIISFCISCLLSPVGAYEVQTVGVTGNSLMDLTQNGTPNAVIYLNPNFMKDDYLILPDQSPTASGYEFKLNPVRFAVEDFIDLIKRVSGATVSIVSQVPADGNCIILATPKSDPSIASKFADDIAWLNDIEGTKYGKPYRYGDDGFAVRNERKKIYIIANNDKGLQNGLYDFLEDNVGIIFSRSDLNDGALFQPQPTIKITKAYYREKSPFSFRGWGLNGMGKSKDESTVFFGGRDWGTNLFELRNKSNIKPGSAFGFGGDYTYFQRVGFEPFLSAHCQHMWFAADGTNDVPEAFVAAHPDYFMTDSDGNPKSGHSGQLNPYSKELVGALTDKMIEYVQKHPNTKTIDLSLNDNSLFYIKDKTTGKLLHREPFTTDCGVTVQPEEREYKSTVYFNFVNRVAKALREKGYDESKGYSICSYAYVYAEVAPLIKELDPMIIPVFAPLNSDMHKAFFESESNHVSAENLENWSKLTNNIVVYNYYGVLYEGGNAKYSRPLAENVQKDFQKYVEMDLAGIHPEGIMDTALKHTSGSTINHTNTWNMNELYFWMITKLMWNPYEDLEALKLEYCQKAYGSAANDMLAYYNAVEDGWDATDDYVWYATVGDAYIRKFMIESGVADRAIAALESAMTKSLTTAQSNRIKFIHDTIKETVTFYANAKFEDGIALKAKVPYEDIIKKENIDFSNEIWKDSPSLTIFKDSAFNDCSFGINVKLLYDEKNLYVAYKVDNSGPGSTEQTAKAWIDMFPPLNAEKSWWDGNIPTYLETYICGNKRFLSNYACYFSDPKGQQFRYLPGIIADNQNPPHWETYGKAVPSSSNARAYYYALQVIPYEAMGTTYEEADITAMFGITGPGIWGWCGGGVWSPASFRQITLVGKEISEGNVKEKLQKLYDENINRESNGYTKDSWDRFKNALDAALAVLQMTEPTKEEITAAYNVLNTAIRGLTKIATAEDKIKLNGLYDQYRLVANINITQESWNTFTTALAAAKAILDNPNVTKAEVDQAYNTLFAAAKGLTYYATYVELHRLNSLYNANKDKPDDNYTQESYAELQAALSKAKAVFEGQKPIQQTVLAATDAINRAVQGLIKNPADKAALRALYDAYKDTKIDYKTKESFDRFTAELINTKSILDNPVIGQAKVDIANDTLQIAINGLRYDVPALLDLDMIAQNAGKDLFKVNVFNPDAPNTNIGLGLTSGINGNAFILEFVWMNMSRTYAPGKVKDITTSYIEIPFYGTGFEIYGPMTYWKYPAANVYVDGVLTEERIHMLDKGKTVTATYCPYLPFAQNKTDQLLYKKDAFEPGLHTLKIVPVRTHGLDDPLEISTGDFRQELNVDHVIFFNDAPTAETVDKASLEILYINNKDIAEADYSAGWSEFKAALAAAKAIIDKSDATQAEVNSEITTLQNAINGLVLKPNKYEIIAATGEGGKITPVGCTAVSAGGDQTFTFTPAEGYIVSSVIVDGVLVSTKSSYTFSAVSMAHTIEVTFVKEETQQAPDLYPLWQNNTQYSKADIVFYNNVFYRCLQAHKSQADWTPDAAPSLWVSIPDPYVEYPEWKQPLGAHDAYPLGAKVTYKGNIWASVIDANVYAPDIYGWKKQ